MSVVAVLASEDTKSKFVDLDVAAAWWIGLLVLIAVLLLIDLLVVHKEGHEVRVREAAIESAVWISIGLLFGLAVWWGFGGAAAGEYYSGYLIEKSLSVDNVFVWALILSYFAVPSRYQHRVLFWGIFGALLLRAVFIFAGVALIEKFEWVLYLFGAFLLFTAIKLVFSEDEHVDPSTSKTLKLIHRFVPMHDQLDGQKLFTKVNGKRFATPLFAVLLLIEVTDVLFAVDSVPAVLAVSHEQFVVFSSNAFAILGLRALYFLLADMHARFSYLQEGLAIILAFVGVKMLVHEWYHIPTWLSLTVIALVLLASVGFSLKVGERADTISIAEEPPPPDER
ncbi:MAG TPA: TerC family protein [Ilumatobacteraceae bacterium]|nr:TerC family protein [Ilumatobacteraceae bacterium]